MDLLTPSPANDEQQELSARALRACLAAEAALASLRAECSPLQSSLRFPGEAGSRNLELAHRSLQLQIDACESLTLCATAAFKQLCDAHFLPSSRKGANSQLVHNGHCHPSTKSYTEYEARKNWKCQACEGTVHQQPGIHPPRDAPNTFGNPLSSLLTMESDEDPGDCKSPKMSIQACKFRPSTPSKSSQKPLKEIARKSQFSEPQSPMEFSGKPETSSSIAFTEGDILLAAVKEPSIGVSPSLGFETKEMRRTHLEGLQSNPCSSSDKDYAEGSGPAFSNICLKNLSGNGSQPSGSQAASRRNLQSSHSSSPSLAGNREFVSRKGRMLPSFSSITSSPASNEKKTMLTDHQKSVHRQDSDGNEVSNSAAHLSCRAAHPTGSPYRESAEASPHSTKSAQSYKLVGSSCPPPTLNGLTQGNNNTSNFCNQRGKSHPLDTNGHFRSNSPASSSSDRNSRYHVVENLDSDKSQAKGPNAYQDNHGRGEKGMEFPSSPYTGFVASRGGPTYDEQGTNPNMPLSNEAASFVNPNAAGRDYEHAALPRKVPAVSEQSRHSWGGSALPQNAVAYQIWPSTLTSDTQLSSTGGQTNFPTRSFAEAKSLRPFTKEIAREGLRAFEPETCSLNDLKKWQVVTKLDAEFPDKCFSAHTLRHKGTTAQIEEASDSAEDIVSKNWFQVPSDLKQPQRVLDIMASFVDIESEDDTDEEGNNEDGEEDN
ncbi:unnamed protein product [Calypogeia fissa]